MSDVIVLERAVPGAEASSAAAGMLAAQIESRDDAELDGYVAAREAYANWAASLRELTGVDIGYRRSGALSIVSPEGLDAARRLVDSQRARGLRAELIDGTAARMVEPELASGVMHALHFSDEAQVDPPQLLRALSVATSRAGVVIRGGSTVSMLLTEGGRCVGVSLDGREILRADAVVLAAGSWSSLVPGVPDELPRVRPVRGQLLMLEERPARLGSIVFSGHAYVVPRGDGRVVCGATMEHVGHRRELTAAGIHTVLGNSIAIAPRLGEAEFVRAWSNFRPQVATSDGSPGAPLVGRSPLPGLFLATGHHRNGILLAKVTADTVANAVTAAPPR
ncbi:Glycine oxidase ThiO [Labilithrix luteola]|uniref:Glycine oxidase ThiO n=1 Tax=Labilithrix luteola TaxID=1391654 RepID=A0A0K1PYZ2_9BACT|nr:Glycine oxidase ThiO [Labilithrix luteola]